jgi:hypothetical protein
LKVIINNQCNCIYRDYFKKSKKFAIDSLANRHKQLEDLKVLNLTLMKDLEDYKANLDKTKLEKKNLENKIFEVIGGVERMENKNELANIEINKLKTEIQKQNKQKSINDKRIEELKHKNELLMKEKIGNEKSNKETNFIDFYDVIVDIKSIKEICNGWQIKMNENSKANYENFRKNKVLKIGVIGNANKGKSFLLSKISKITLPSGTSIRTEGLSIKYPDLKEYQNRNIVLLDSAGLETPVLIDENENIQKGKTKNITNDNKEMEKIFREKSIEKN